MTRAIIAGVLFFGIVFATGFALAVPRMLLLEPRMGALGAVLIEVPVMLAVSWVAAGVSIRGVAVPGRTGARFTMGLVAFTLLMAAELAVGVLLMGMTPAGHFSRYASEPAAALGLAAQVTLIAMPVLRLRGL